MSPLVWTESVTVRTDDLTPMGDASLPALGAYLQEAAGPHAAALGVSMDALAEDGRAWVLARLRMHVDRRPSRGRTVTIETWPSGLNGLYATREFEIAVGGTDVGRATSAWFLIDLERRRPVRPPRAVRTLDPPDRPPALPHEEEALARPTRTDHEHTTTVGYHDLDRNEHVNNVRYLAWALDALPTSVFETYRCRDVALEFRHEVARGAPVRVAVEVGETSNGLQGRHSVQHGEDGHTLAVVNTSWTVRST